MADAAAILFYAPGIEEAVNKLVRKIIGPLIDQIQYDHEKEKKYEIRNLILVIVTVIAAMTFQTGINPPGGLWQDNQKEHVAGSAIFAYRKQAAFYVFLVFNTLAFTTSALILFLFTQGFPYSLEIRLAIVSVVVTYACAVSVTIPPESANLAYVLLVALLPIVVLSLIRRWATQRAIRKEEERKEEERKEEERLRRLGIEMRPPPTVDAV